MVRFLHKPAAPSRNALAPSVAAERVRGNRSPGTAGFTLIELMIVMVIIGILASIAIPAYTRSVHAAREAALREDLYEMRRAIDSYTVDKQKAPQALQDLVTAGYLKEIPRDPITNRNDTWMPVTSDVLSTVDQTDAGGIDDVHSGAQATGTDGRAYNTW